MALTGLELLLRNADNIGFQLIPHIEERATAYVVHNTVMANRVRVATDMSDWNVRKSSEYIRSRRAGTLAEDTAIPSTKMLRVRKSISEPLEVGDKYRISNRRGSTDLEDIVADTIKSLGESISWRVEVDLLGAALSAFTGGTLGGSSTDWTINLMLQAATIFRSQGRRGALFHVTHPYAVLNEMEKLIEYNNSSQQAPLSFRDGMASGLAGAADLRSFNFGAGFGVSNVAISELLPRRVIYQLITDATGGTFRLEIGDGGVQGTNITADITYSVTPATLVSNIQAALDALPTSATGGTWVVSGTDVTDITLTPPAAVYHNYPDRIRVANKRDEDAVLESDLGTEFMKPYYDELTGAGTLFTDKDGNIQRVVLRERVGATCLSPLFMRDALIWDVRQGVKSFFALPDELSGRTAEYSGYMVYGHGGWSPELGMFIETKAEAPNAVPA